MKEHWESIYKEKGPEEVSWTQEVPTPSLKFIERVELPKDASIIDIGGGDSKLVDHLLERGYENLSVLDLSEKALDKAKERLGEQADEEKLERLFGEHSEKMETWRETYVTPGGKEQEFLFYTGARKA